MKIELNKDGLIDLVNGVSPNYNLFEHTLIKSCGSYNASNGIWSWDNEKLRKLTEQEIYYVYIICKESYK